jgi:membrane protein
MYKKLIEELIKLYKIIKTELWSTDLKEFNICLRPLLFLCRFFYLVFIDFAQKKTLMVASALSYATVLGVIPITLVIMALSKGLLEQSLTKYTPQIIDFLVAKALPFLNDLSSRGTGVQLYNSLQDYINLELIPTLTNLNLQEIGFYGAIVLIVISFSLMRTIEKAFNDIWGVVFKRSIWKLVLSYWLVIALFPVVMLVILWVTGFSVFHDVLRIGNATWLSRTFSDQGGTFLILWVLFTTIYKVIPNTRVKLMPALIGGVVGGTLWQLNNTISFIFVSNAIRAHYIYGSIGMIPILLIALFVGWLIVLFGAHISFAVQNLEYFRIKLLATDIQPSDRQEIALICLAIIAIRFLNKKSPPTTDDISERSGLPVGFFLRTLEILKNAGYVYQTDDTPTGYVLLISPESIRLKDIMDTAIGHTNDKKLPLVSNKSLWKESIKICTAYRDSFSSQANPTLLEIAEVLKEKI